MGRINKTPPPPHFALLQFYLRKKAKKAKLHTIFNFKFTLTNTWNF